MENDRPSTNDIVNTTLGGMTRGEISHRLSIMILDNTASGANRFFRELGAAIVNPVNALSRLVHGDMTRDFPNPEERYPNSFSISADLGYRHIEPDAGHRIRERYRSRLCTATRSGDIQKPARLVLDRLRREHARRNLDLPDRARRILKAGSSATRRTPRDIFGFAQEYEYLNNESQVVGAQMFSAGLLSRYKVGKLALVTDFSILAVPLAGIKTTDFENPQTGRNYDYAPGGDAGGRSSLRRRAESRGRLWRRLGANGQRRLPRQHAAVLSRRGPHSNRWPARIRRELLVVQPADDLRRIHRAAEDAVGIPGFPESRVRRIGPAQVR